jgi:pimeloyl-ACP methyl ester carboxylesterase
MTDTVNYFDPYPKNVKTVLLLHGLGSDHGSWVYQIDTLGEAGYRPIAVDIPGFGKSEFTLPHWTVRRAALIISNKLLDNIPGTVDLIGLSMGGTIAQQLIKIRPDRVGRVILVSTFARLRPTVRKNLPYLSKRVKQMVLGDIRKQAATVADRIFPDNSQIIFHDYLLEQIRTANPKIYRQAMLSLTTFNSTYWMRKWDQPTLVVAGSGDSTVTLKNQKRLAELPRNVIFKVIEGGGHALTIDHRDDFNKLMVNFLSN